MEHAAKFRKDGYVIVRNLFSPAEAREIRARALEVGPTSQELLSIAALRGVLLDERVLEVVRSLIGRKLVYFGDSNVSIDAPSHGFHKDNPDRNDPNGPDWKGDYPLVRFGIYTQSHKGKPNGLDLRRGSHLIASTKAGEHVYCETEPGDVVFWNLRTTHSGWGITVRGRPVDPDSLPGRLLWRFPTLRDRHEERRVVLFASYGAPSEHLERYVEYLKSRQYGVDAFLSQQYDAEALQLARARDVIVRDMRTEVLERPAKEVRADHFQLPY
jgi:hypothetical protein